MRSVVGKPAKGPTAFTKNRERLQQGDIFQRFMSVLLHHPKVKPLLSGEHFSVDGTLIEAWASHRSFQPKDGSGGDGTDFYKQKRSNKTHACASSRAPGTARCSPSPTPRAASTKRPRGRNRSSAIWGMR
jgi:hypothetical protein